MSSGSGQAVTESIPVDSIYAFAPSASRALFLDDRMRSELASSAVYLASRLRPHIAINDELLTQFLSRVASGPVSPLAFAVYADLVFAIDDDHLAEAALLWEFLIAQPSHPGGLLVKDLTDPSLDESADRYVRYVDTDPDMPLPLTCPSEESARLTRERITGALLLLDENDPELAGEIRALLREVILCGGSQQSDYTFDGASSFMLWGAILINADRRGDDLGMVQMLAHESAHNLLFGLCPNELLLRNDPEERHPSPLRHDPRPLEGIYHATFVCARMHRAIRNLAASGALTEGQQEHAEIALAANQRAFTDGLTTLDKHADLTEPGRVILEGARTYMQTFA